jgi:hypothetical protein
MGILHIIMVIPITTHFFIPIIIPITTDITDHIPIIIVPIGQAITMAIMEAIMAAIHRIMELPTPEMYTMVQGIQDRQILIVHTPEGEPLLHAQVE